jgi:hypothetical protein
MRCTWLPELGVKVSMEEVAGAPVVFLFALGYMYKIRSEEITVNHTC